VTEPHEIKSGLPRRREQRLNRINYLWAIAAMLVALAAVLMYGYRFETTHGSLSVIVDDVSDREHPRPLVPVQLSFLDKDGNVLATASSAPPDGVIYLVSPAEYSCHKIELRAGTSPEARREWAACFDRESRWPPTWITRVQSVNLRNSGCEVDALPMSVSEYRDAW
jgi:hypothetical protein